MKQQPIRVDTMRGNRCTSSACDALAAEQCNATPHSAIPTYPVQYPRAMRSIANPGAPPTWRVPEGPDSLAAVPMGGGRAWLGFDGKLHHTQRHKRRRCGGRRRVRRARLRCPWAGGGAWPGFEATRRAKLAARTARGRAAAHGHNQQPGLTAHHAAPQETQHRGAGPQARAPSATTQTLRSTDVPCRSARAARRSRRSSRSLHLRRRAGRRH